MDRQCSSCGGFCKQSGCERENVKPVVNQSLTTQPAAWVSLTDEKINQFIDHYWADDNVLMRDLIRMVEQEVRELNNA